jgi:DUF4097 and DUF4098 domain-containing protein YvlB
MIVLCGTGVFAEGSAEMANERSFSLKGIKTISIEYSSGRLVFMEGADDTFSFREYLSGDNPDYHALSSSTGGIITVEPGRRPWFRHLRARLEVYIPRSFEGDYRVLLGSGSIEARTGITASGVIAVEVTSGVTRLQSLNAPDIKLRSQSGSIYAESLYGNTDIRVSSGGLNISRMHGSEHQVRLLSGSAEIEAASGAGRFSSASGNIKLGITSLNGNLDFDISSGGLDLNLPLGAAFNLDAETSSGRVKVESGADTFSVRNRSSVVRPVGDNPEFTIRIAVSSGNITLRR